MKDRIRKIMEMAHLSQQEFAARLEISPASLSSIFTGRTNPTNNHVQAIHRAFPNINVNWLMFGEGEMFNSSPGDESESSDLASGNRSEDLFNGANGNRDEGGGGPESVTNNKNGADGASDGGLLFADSSGASREVVGGISGSRPLTGEVLSSHFSSKSSPSRTGRGGIPVGDSRGNFTARGSQTGVSERIMENINVIDRTMRKIKEIRVFFDDGTYEAFVPSGK